MPGGLARHQLLAPQAGEQAAQVAQVEIEIGAELARGAGAALPELVQHTRLRQWKRAAEVARVQRADAARIEAVELPYRLGAGMRSRHAACSAGILAFVK